MVILSVTGLFRTVLIIIGVVVLLRFIGRLMIAKRNLDAHERARRDQRESEELKANSQKNFGKTTISKIGKSKYGDGDFVDYEEIKED